MKTTYIFHSSFLVETAACYYLFDYHQGDLPTLDPQKPIMVFSSHRHPDHYSAKIFMLLKERGMQQIYAVLSKDIPKSAYPKDVPVTTVTFHQSYELALDTHLETFLSTDEGVAFWLTCPEGSIYHAGDLHDWVWEGEAEQDNRQMTGRYRHEIDLMKGRSVDLAFLLLDPRQEKDYAKGILYFLKQVNAKQVFPMHYWQQPQIIHQFINEYPEYAEIIRYTEDYR